MSEPTLPWGLEAYNAIQAALYFLEEGEVPLSDDARKLRAVEILREIKAPTPADCGEREARALPK